MIRVADIEDAEKIAKLEEENFLSSAWSEADILKALADCNYLIIKNTNEEDCHNHHKCNEENDENNITGYIMILLTAYEAEILRICTCKRYRRKKIAYNLLKNGLSEVKRLNNNVESVYLEVRETNHAAITLYEKSDFKKIGQRKNYYKNPIEDAICMKYDYTKECEVLC